MIDQEMLKCDWQKIHFKIRLSKLSELTNSVSNNAKESHNFSSDKLDKQLLNNESKWAKCTLAVPEKIYIMTNKTVRGHSDFFFYLLLQ